MIFLGGNWRNPQAATRTWTDLLAIAPAYFSAEFPSRKRQIWGKEVFDRFNLIQSQLLRNPAKRDAFSKLILGLCQLPRLKQGESKYSWGMLRLAKRYLRQLNQKVSCWNFRKILELVRWQIHFEVLIFCMIGLKTRQIQTEMIRDGYGKKRELNGFNLTSIFNNLQLDLAIS